MIPNYCINRNCFHFKDDLSETCCGNKWPIDGFKDFKECPTLKAANDHSLGITYLTCKQWDILDKKSSLGKI